MYDVKILSDVRNGDAGFYHKTLIPMGDVQRISELIVFPKFRVTGTPTIIRKIEFQEGVWHGPNGERLEVSDWGLGFVSIQLNYEVQKMKYAMTSRGDVAYSEITNFPEIGRTLAPMVSNPNETLYSLTGAMEARGFDECHFRRQYVVHAGGSERPQFVITEHSQVFGLRHRQRGPGIEFIMVAGAFVFLGIAAIAAAVIMKG